MKKKNYFLVIFFLAAGIVGLISSLILVLPRARGIDVSLPIKGEIERATQVKGLENKFIHIEFRSGLFGGFGAGAGGLGAPQIFTKDAKQFLELVPANEPIYVAIEQGKSPYGDDPYVVKKVYMAFIENRAGVMIYEDTYQYQDRYSNGRIRMWPIKSFNSEQITFSNIEMHGNENIAWYFQILMTIIPVVLIFFGCLFASRVPVGGNT